MNRMPANPAAAVYGTITVGALLAGESAQRETYPRTLGAVAIALLLYWLAHSYASFAARRLLRGERLNLRGLAWMMAHELPILIGSAIPLVVLLIWWAAGAKLTGGVNAAIWTSAAMIVILELVAGLRARLFGRELFAQATLGALLGLLVIALKLVLH
jgi:hypothetical protein